MNNPASLVRPVTVAVFDSSGRILRTVSGPYFALKEQTQPGEQVVVVPDDVRPDSHYVQHNQVVAIPPKPGQFYDWNWSSRTWVGNLPAAKAARRAKVDAQVALRTVQPITVGGVEFDADEVARSRIKGTLDRILRGDGLPTGWAGWRDADNAMHWSEATPDEVAAELSALSRAIEDREQALLIAAWTHKAYIDALNRVEDVVAYSLTTGW